MPDDSRLVHMPPVNCPSPGQLWPSQGPVSKTPPTPPLTLEMLVVLTVQCGPILCGCACPGLSLEQVCLDRTRKERAPTPRLDDTVLCSRHVDVPLHTLISPLLTYVRCHRKLPGVDWVNAGYGENTLRLFNVGHLVAVSSRSSGPCELPVIKVSRAGCTCCCQLRLAFLDVSRAGGANRGSEAGRHWLSDSKLKHNNKG